MGFAVDKKVAETIYNNIVGLKLVTFRRAEFNEP